MFGINNGSLGGAGGRFMGTHYSGPFIAISAGACHFIALKADHSVVVFGEDEWGQWGQRDVPRGIGPVALIAALPVPTFNVKLPPPAALIV